MIRFDLVNDGFRSCWIAQIREVITVFEVNDNDVMALVQQLLLGRSTNACGTPVSTYFPISNSCFSSLTKCRWRFGSSARDLCLDGCPG